MSDVMTLRLGFHRRF